MKCQHNLETRTETPCWEEGFGQQGRREQSECTDSPEPHGAGIGGIGGVVDHARDLGAAIAAGLSPILENKGPGGYTSVLWDRPDHMTGTAPLPSPAIFWKTEPAEGNPCR